MNAKHVHDVDPVDRWHYDQGHRSHQCLVREDAQQCLRPAGHYGRCNIPRTVAQVEQDVADELASFPQMFRRANGGY